jgi:branched-chain amino acid transport system substrate-binding protein
MAAGNGRRRMIRMGRLTTLLALAACLVGAVACGDDDDDTTTERSSEVSADAEPATGSPVVLGALDVPNQPQFSEGIRASVEYLNKEGGGLAGHRVELKTCTADQTPQQGIKCANELVRAGAVAVVIGEDVSADSAFPIYERAGVPVISERVVTNQLLVNPVALALGPGIPATFAAIAKFATEDLGAKKVTALQAQGVPQELLDQLVGGPLGAAGLETEYAFFDPARPNFSATFAAIAKDDPDIVIANIDDNKQCAPAMQAARSLGADFKLFQITCSDDEVFEAAGALTDGVVFYGPLDSVAGVDSPDVQLYDHILSTYGGGEAGFQSAVAVSSVLTLARVLEEQQDKEVTSKAILDGFENASGVDIFMGPPLECGVSEAFPRLCTLSLRFFTGEGGEKKSLTDFISGPNYLPQG